MHDVACEFECPVAMRSSDGRGRPFNKLTSVFYASVLLLIINFVITLTVKVAVDPRGDSRVDPQTTLTM